MRISSEQVLALAPDSAAAISGRKLSEARLWTELGCHATAIWGSIQGSGKSPYRACVDLRDLAFRCSCPSRKFPCKHGLALLLLHVDQPQSFSQIGSTPDWVGEWLKSRDKKSSKGSASSPGAGGVAEEAPPASDPSPERIARAARRDERIDAGVEELELWLRDIVRQGLATIQGKDRAFWLRPASRMVDAQAPGLRRRILSLAATASSGRGWQDRLLEQAGRLYLLTQGCKRRASLPDEVRLDIETAIGRAADKESALTADPIEDDWQVVGQRQEFDEFDARLQVRKTWLWGSDTNRPALLLDFAYGAQPFAMSVPIGMVFRGKLGYFPSAAPLRALWQDREFHSPKVLTDVTGAMGLDEALASYSVALAANPWIEEYPFLLRNVVSCRNGADFLLRDNSGHALPISDTFQRVWELLALGGGRPVDLMGEWNGETLYPLSVWVSGQFFTWRQSVSVEVSDGQT